MASIGWSTGDVLSTIKLVNRIVQCIDGARNARDDFRELLSELQALSTALNEISELTRIPGQTPEIQALKFASCSCSETLQRFYEKVHPFEGTLGTDSRQSKLKAAPRMVRWELLIKKDVPELRSYLVAHVGALNLRLSTALLKSSSTSQLQGRHIIEQQDMSSNTLLQLAKDQAIVVERISQIPTTETVPKLEALLSIAIGVWQSQNKIMSYLAQASQSLPPPDLDNTWAQSPFKFEDALGRRFVIPSEYDWDKIEALIQVQFKKGPGSVKVRSGDYELFDQRTGLSVSESNFFMLVPGSYITMAIILGRYRGFGLAPDGCTRAVCRSPQVKMVNSLTMACMECQSTFRKANKTLPRPMKQVDSPRTILETPTPGTKADYLAWLDSRYYKNMSIHFVELPATPAKFREKYARDYTRPMPQLMDTSPEQSLLQPENETDISGPVRKLSIFVRLLRGNQGSEIPEPQAARQRNSGGLRSTLQRHISRTPLARLNFHSSAQEKYFRRSKKPSSDHKTIAGGSLMGHRPEQAQDNHVPTATATQSQDIEAETPPRDSPQTSAMLPGPAPPQSVSTNDFSKYRCSCGFEPDGEEAYKLSSLKRHQKTRGCHQIPPYNPSETMKPLRSSYPDSPKNFTRRDDPRVHQKEERHYLVRESLKSGLFSLQPEVSTQLDGSYSYIPNGDTFGPELGVPGTSFGGQFEENDDTEYMTPIPPPPPRDVDHQSHQHPGLIIPPPPDPPPVSDWRRTWGRSYDAASFPLTPPNPLTNTQHQTYDHSQSNVSRQPPSLSIPPPPTSEHQMTATYVPDGDSFGPGVGIPSFFKSFPLSPPSLGPPMSELSTTALVQTHNISLLEYNFKLAQDTSQHLPDNTRVGQEEAPSKLPSLNEPQPQQSPDFWTRGTVSLFLAQHQFSAEWITTLASLNLEGTTFLDLGSGFGGRGNFGMMHQEVYPRLAKECARSGNGWNQEREREEGRRLRRLIRKAVNGTYAFAGPTNFSEGREVEEGVPSTR